MMNRKTKFLWLLGVHGFIQFTADVYQFMDTIFCFYNQIRKYHHYPLPQFNPRVTFST